MRRIGLVVLAAGILATACGSFRDVFTSHAETAARVGSRELPSARVAEIINRLGGPTANPQAADLIAGIWVDMALFADQVAQGKLSKDSATMARLMWPQITEAKIQAWHDSVIAKRTGLSPDAVDSAYNAGDIRLFQHILFMPAGPTAADTSRAKAQAEKVLPQTRAGDFGKLAAQYSSDGSKSDNGFLPPGPKGTPERPVFVTEFETPAWALAPGGISGVVKSQFGYHIIRRPPLAEVRDRLTMFFKQQQVARADSAYMAELTAKAELNVKPGAAAAIRTAAADPVAARKSSKELVSYKGGSFRVKDLSPWLEALPMQSAAQIKIANDTILEGFARTLAQNEILLKQADSAKVTMNPAQFESMSAQFKSAIDALREAMGLNTPEFSDSSKVPEAERRKLAATKVEEYFDKLVKGEAQFRQIPPTLSAELRHSGDYRIFPQGTARAKELIVAQRAKDSAAAAGAGARPAPGLQPAPGGPPGQTARPDSVKTP
jgi:PPIC-type peptidyl-prolyl cis-trans isomerase-like protein